MDTYAAEIFNSITDGKDGTLDILAGLPLPEHGYFVGGVGTPLVFESVEAANLGLIHQFIENTEAGFVGWWTDQETGKLYVDGSSWHSFGPAAMHAAAIRGEIAFWDIAGQQEVRLS